MKLRHLRPVFLLKFFFKKMYFRSIDGFNVASCIGFYWFYWLRDGLIFGSTGWESSKGKLSKTYYWNKLLIKFWRKTTTFLLSCYLKNIFFTVIIFQGKVFWRQSSQNRNFSDLFGQMECHWKLILYFTREKQTLRSRKISMLTLHR